MKIYLWNELPIRPIAEQDESAIRATGKLIFVARPTTLDCL